MSDNRQISEEYAKIGTELIECEDALIDIRNSQATIIYLSSDYAKTDKGKPVLGQLSASKTSISGVFLQISP